MSDCGRWIAEFGLVTLPTGDRHGCFAWIPVHSHAVTDASDNITKWLAEVRNGDPAVVDQLVSALHDELRVIAARYLRRERGNHTLQPTALVNEAYLRLAGQHHVEWKNRAHFLGIAATVMRRFLVDYARAHDAERRGGDLQRVTLDEFAGLAAERPIEILDLESALERLASLDPRMCRVIELRFYGGLTSPEIAEVLDISEATVEREKKAGVSWLRAVMEPGDG